MQPQSLKISDLLTSGPVPTIMTFCLCSTVKYDLRLVSFFILKTHRMFNFIFVRKFLSHTIYSVLDCHVVLHHLAKTEVLCICCGGLQIARAVTESERNVAAASGGTHFD